MHRGPVTRSRASARRARCRGERWSTWRLLSDECRRGVGRLATTLRRRPATAHRGVHVGWAVPVPISARQAPPWQPRKIRPPTIREGSMSDRDAEDDALLTSGRHAELLAAYYPVILERLRLRLTRDEAYEVAHRVVERL